MPNKVLGTQKKKLTTLVSTGTSAAVASAASGGSSGSLGLYIALGGTGLGLVDGLDGGNRLVLARVVVACKRDAWLVSCQLGARRDWFGFLQAGRG